MYGASPNLQIPSKGFASDGSTAMSGDLDMGGNQVTNMGAPASDTDAATKAYVDNAIEGLKHKDSVRAASTANVTLATDVENGDTLDGVTLATGDRILLKDQSTGSENGIYVVAASGAPARASDLDTGDGAASAAVFVEEGSTNAERGYVCSSDGGSDVVGTDALTWVHFNSGAVTSVFGRTGAVVATANDYDASEVNNDSGVSGATVAAALDTLDSGKAASSHTHVEADITDLGAYITDVTAEPLGDLSDVTITTIASGEILKWNGSAWINNTLAEAGIAAASHSHAASDITSGTLAHEQGGLEADVSAYNGLVKIASGSTSAVTAPTGDIVGTTDLQTLSSKTLNLPTIAAFDNAQHNHQTAAGGGTLTTAAIASGMFADARISQSSVTQHQAALSITESQISDLGAYITDITGEPLSDLSDVTITTIASGELLKWNGSAWINQTLAEAGIAASTHATTHQSGGSDAIKLDDLAAPDDNTDLNVSTSAHGLAPKLNNDAGTWFDGTGSYSAPDDTEITPALATASDGATVTFDLSSALKQQVTLGGNRTLALSNVPGNGAVFTIKLIQDGSGNHTVTWFSGITWAGGSAPTLTTTASKADQFIFIKTGSGAYDGFIVGQNL